jgi:RimJ/RimL family protein N-acetyltransferase
MSHQGEADGRLRRRMRRHILLAMTVMETERLVMRPLTGDDFDDYARMLADPEVAGGLAESVGTSPDDAWRSLATFHA